MLFWGAWNWVFRRDPIHNTTPFKGLWFSSNKQKQKGYTVYTQILLLNVYYTNVRNKWWKYKGMWPSQGPSMKHLETTKNTLSPDHETPSPCSSWGNTCRIKLSVFYLAAGPSTAQHDTNWSIFCCKVKGLNSTAACAQTRKQNWKEITGIGTAVFQSHHVGLVYLETSQADHIPLWLLGTG